MNYSINYAGFIDIKMETDSVSSTIESKHGVTQAYEDQESETQI